MNSLVVGLFGIIVVHTQPLDIDQHAALMSLYNGLSQSPSASFAENAQHFQILLFHLSFADCPESTCPRFRLNETCTGNLLICSQGFVSRM